MLKVTCLKSITALPGVHRQQYYNSNKNQASLTYPLEDEDDFVTEYPQSNFDEDDDLSASVIATLAG